MIDLFLMTTARNNDRLDYVKQLSDFRKGVTYKWIFQR